MCDRDILNGMKLLVALLSFLPVASSAISGVSSTEYRKYRVLTYSRDNLQNSGF